MIDGILHWMVSSVKENLYGLLKLINLVYAPGTKLNQ